jgi:hypothetical protein
MANKIFKVTRFPMGDIPPGVVYFNTITREVKTNTTKGTKIFSADFIYPDIDVFSAGGYFPLYRSIQLAASKSPLGRFIAYGEAELGPAPPGITYPVYMPEAVNPSYLGNYLDPLGDHDGDGIPNYRDSNLLGSSALPTAGYNGTDPFVTSGGINVNLKDYLNNPDQGIFNDSNSSMPIDILEVGILVGPDGAVSQVNPPSTTIPVGFTLFLEIPSDIVSTSNSIQWFEENSEGDLIMRDTFFDSSGPAIHLWEQLDSDSYSPRNVPLESNTESAQYFEENAEGDITPKDSPN